MNVVTFTIMAVLCPNGDGLIDKDYSSEVIGKRSTVKGMIKIAINIEIVNKHWMIVTFPVQ